MSKQNLMTRDAADGIASKAVTRLAELAKKPQHRQADVSAVDIEARTVVLSFSSEIEYRRYYGIEILGHSAGEVRMGRLKDGAAALWNHNWDDMRGVVESARIDADAVGRAVIRLSRSPAGEQMLQDLADGIITKVSVGYLVHGVKLVEEREDGDVYRMTDWEPYEISFVSVPADNTVGVGRKAEIPPEEPKTPKAETSDSTKNTAATRTTIKDQKPMNYRYYTEAGKQYRVAQNAAGEDIGSPELVVNADAERNLGAAAERARVAELMTMADQFVTSIPNARELAQTHIAEGHAPAAFQKTLLEAFNARAAKPLADQSAATELGMSTRDVGRYSFMNVIRALANPNDQAAQRAAAFELECSVAAQKTLGRSAKGMLVPPDVLARAMTTFQPSAGAQMVSSEKGSFLDLLRNKTTIMRLATVLTGLVGNLDIPKKTSDGQAYWLGEGQDAGETGFSLGQLSMSPKTLGAFTEMTRRLMMQSDSSVEGMVRSDLILAFAQAIDYAGFYGKGTEYQPRGLKFQSGINAVDFATQQRPSFAEFVDMESEIAADNAESAAYIMHTRVRGHCKKTLQFPGVNGSQTIWEPGATVNGYRTEVTNQLAADDVFHGDFSDFVVGLWSGMDITVDPYSLSKSGGLRIVAFQDLDMLLRRPESICWGSHAVTP